MIDLCDQKFVFSNSKLDFTFIESIKKNIFGSFELFYEIFKRFSQFGNFKKKKNHIFAEFFAKKFCTYFFKILNMKSVFPDDRIKYFLNFL